MKEETINFLEKSAGSYHNSIVHGWEGLYEYKREMLYQTLKKFHFGVKGLELGSADGIMTTKIYKDFESLTVVDGAPTMLRLLSEKEEMRNVTIVQSLFEQFEPVERYDTIFMTHILEHLDDPVGLLNRAKRWLNEGGRILIAVPNAQSLHRLLGVKMGMLAQPDSLNEQDVLLGHKRIYCFESLLADVEKAGLKVMHKGGLMLKLLSNRQIEKQWSQELIKGCFDLGFDFPELCSEIFLVAHI